MKKAGVHHNPMPVFYALKEPKVDERWNFACLKEAARLKGSLLGVYYSPRLRRPLAVFKTTPDTSIDEAFFERIDPF